ncbi:hypothetical protein G5I_08993 [Acromyrmex echinatior]|uniref:Uncharacterized protein n=1 Tax=Acromyrmex echinatior TaxID=103372 RepID=F4WT19_ACREC|nr:hypothetical protein G5I_08993 [Acromyrmex echinatior]
MHRNHLANYLPKLTTEWRGIVYHRTSLISRNDQRAYSRSGCPLETLRQRNVIYVCSREGWMAAYRGYEKRSVRHIIADLAVRSTTPETNPTNRQREAGRRECAVEVISKKGINCTVAVVDISSIPHHSN